MKCPKHDKEMVMNITNGYGGVATRYHCWICAKEGRSNYGDWSVTDLITYLKKRR